MKNLYLLPALSVFFLGCSTPKATVAPRVIAPQSLMLTQSISKDKSELAQKAAAEEDNKKIEEELNVILRDCKATLVEFESKSADQAKSAYWLSLSGLIAGSVLAPAFVAASNANGTTVAVLSGWAGATNFAGKSLNSSGLSGSTAAQTHNKIINDLKSEISTITDGNISFAERRGALMRAKASCVVFSISIPSSSSD